MNRPQSATFHTANVGINCNKESDHENNPYIIDFTIDILFREKGKE
jgi:hypothetical protein